MAHHLLSVMSYLRSASLREKDQYTSDFKVLSGCICRSKQPICTSQAYMTRVMCPPAYGRDRTGGDVTASFNVCSAVSLALESGAKPEDWYLQCIFL